MMTYYVVTPEMGVSLLRGGQCKPFSVCPAADDDLKVTVVNWQINKVNQVIVENQNTDAIVYEYQLDNFLYEIQT